MATRTPTSTHAEPRHDEDSLTLKQAAELLNVPSDYLTRLLAAGEIGFTGTGRQRHIRRADLLVYKRERDTARRAALRELTQLSQEAGLGDVPFSALETDPS